MNAPRNSSSAAVVPASLSDSAPFQEVLGVLQEQDSFLLVSHYNPDGDAIGSMAALGFILQRLGKQVHLYNVSGLPASFTWLALPAPIMDKPPRNLADCPTCIVTLDCGDFGRTGGKLNDLFSKRVTVNIDHHLGNSMFGDHNWVDPSFSSTGEMVARLADALNIPLDGALGEALYLAMVTDTGYFSYGNTSPETMETAGRIIRLGLQPGEINKKIQNQWTEGRLRLISKVLDAAEFHNNGRIGMVRITRQILRQTGTSREDSDGLINLVRRVRTVDIAIAMREEDNGKIKFSLRSDGEVNVQAVAASFGGGGHKNASGGQLDGPMDRAADLLRNACAKVLGEK
ncbi:MAG: DHH family phosphoesterase [Desulfovibrio sp.]|uniref:DHH family phosphoesterase n=1 Tax=Desulfovibrio sp. 7SRBS1 TaxID=3378064 RepID=UPI003B3FF870